MAFSDVDALAMAKIWLPEDEHQNNRELWPSLAALFKQVYEKGVEDGQSQDAKFMFWAGLQAGLLRASWIMGGVRYVGPIATPDNTLQTRMRDLRSEALAAGVTLP